MDALAGLLAFLAILRPAQPEAMAMKPGAYLLFDREYVAQAENFHLAVGPVRKDGPVLEPEKPWEARGIWAWHSVIYENGVVRLWYDAVGEDGVWRMCYAVSTDGLHFVRPSLGLYEYGGSRENNICFVAPKGYHGGAVFRDPSAPPEERYKLVYGGGGRIGDSPYLHVSAAVSPDGIRWRHAADKIIEWYTDTGNVCYYDEAAGKYRLFVRYWTGKFRYEGGRIVGREDYGKRAVGYAESEDFHHFPGPRPILAPDRYDPPDMDIYNSAACKYPLADGAYFLFPSCFHHGPDALDVQIAVSRDGATYKRPVREPFVPLGPQGSFDSRQIYMGPGMCVVGDQIWMYYAGYDVGHGQARPGRATAKYGRIAVLRDRFLGWRTDAEGGELVTKLLEVRGQRLFVNANCSAGGFLRAAVEGADGKVVEGFGLDDCAELRGNLLRAELKWRGGSIGRLQGRQIRLRLRGRLCTMYALYVE